MIEKIVTGIVLEKFVFEDEHIVKILSEGGDVVSLKAKGLDNYTSKNRMSLNIFNTVEVEYFTSPSNRKHTGRLKTARANKEFIKDNENTLNVMNVVRNLILDTNNNSILTYKTLERIIFSLENNNLLFQEILALMIITLRQNGITPIIDRCVKCGSNQDITSFSIYEGGLMCKKHEESKQYELKPNTLRKIIEINSLKDPITCRNLDFDQDEKNKIRSMYKMFLENQLAINLYLIDKL